MSFHEFYVAFQHFQYNRTSYKKKVENAKSFLFCLGTDLPLLISNKKFTNKGFRFLEISKPLRKGALNVEFF